MKPRDTAGGIIVSKEKKIVLVWQNRNSWAFPKGGIDEGESLIEAALREIKEETGLSADALTVIEQLPTYIRYSIGIDGTGEDMSRPASTRNLFLCMSRQADLKPEDKEVTEARWVTVDEALEMLTHPKDAEFLKSIREKIEAINT